MAIEPIEITPRTITLSLALETSEGTCLVCERSSQRVHSRYQRTLQDLPCAGKVLRLRLQVRRFFCINAQCRRKIFAERFPELTSVYARRTTRCTQALRDYGSALGGQAGAHLSARLGLPSHRMTMLRILRRTPKPLQPSPRLLDVDECAYRRGKTYGTIVVDLERGTPVDLLPDRRASTFSTWLKAHPGIVLISRDRAGEFAHGATQGAPETVQIADRFLQQHRQGLKQIHLVTTPAASPSLLLRHLRPDRELRKQRARAALVERDVGIQRLVKQGLSHRAIARQLHMHRESVMRYAKADRFPERLEQPVKPGILAPYETYLRTRWMERERNGVGLWRERVAQGYSGSRMTVERFLLGLRAMEQQGIEISKVATTATMTPRRAVGLMLHPTVCATSCNLSGIELESYLHDSPVFVKQRYY